MSLRAIASPEIDEDQGLHAVASWLDEWQVFLARSKYYHALVQPDDIPEDFPTAAPHTHVALSRSVMYDRLSKRASGA